MTNRDANVLCPYYTRFNPRNDSNIEKSRWSRRIKCKSERMQMMIQFANVEERNKHAQMHCKMNCKNCKFYKILGDV